MREYTTNDILGASFGETKGEIRAKFRKVVMIKDYQPEEFELEATLTLDAQTTGMDRVLITTLLEAQMEMTAYMNMLMQGLVTQKEYDDRMKVIIAEVNGISKKYEAITGKNADDYLAPLSERG